MDQNSRFCASCSRQVLATRPATNHLLHFFVSLFTLGLWVPVWILTSIKVGGWRCQTCGRKV
jgi:DNA-directed RNA polymerase subunit RPC12/RpoP